MSIIDELKANILIDKQRIKDLRDQIVKLESDIKYYQGRYDATNDVLTSLNKPG